VESDESAVADVEPDVADAESDVADVEPDVADAESDMSDVADAASPAPSFDEVLPQAVSTARPAASSHSFEPIFVSVIDRSRSGEARGLVAVLG
jgi:hypothetical protein